MRACVITGDEDDLHARLEEAFKECNRVGAVRLKVGHTALHALVATRHLLHGGKGCRQRSHRRVPLVKHRRQVGSHREGDVVRGVLLKRGEEGRGNGVESVGELPAVQGGPVALGQQRAQRADLRGGLDLHEKTQADARGEDPKPHHRL